MEDIQTPPNPSERRERDREELNREHKLLANDETREGERKRERERGREREKEGVWRDVIFGPHIL